MKEEIYLCIEQCCKVTSDEVRLKDIGTLFCKEEAIRNKLNSIKIYDFKGKSGNRVIITAMRIVEEIINNISNVNVNLIGETDVIIEREARRSTSKIEILKVMLISLIVFFGAGFTIMAFNNDVAVHKVFEQMYYYIMGKKSSGFTLIEIMYSIGLGIGILVFYNHFGRKRLSTDPTPIEVEMREYETRINNTMIDGVKRKNEHIDVG